MSLIALARRFARFSVPIADQAILSLANFGASWICIRALSLAEYGYYALGLAVAYFYTNTIQGLIGTPSSTRTLAWAQRRRDRYLAVDRLLLWMGLATKMALIGALVWVLFGLASPDLTRILHLELVFTMALAGSALALWDFDRAVLIHERRYGWSFLVSVAYASALLGGILWLSQSDRLSAAGALMCFAGAGLVGSVVRLFMPGIAPVRLRRLKPRITAWWRRGGHSLGYGWAVWARDNLYLFVASTFLGTQAGGALAAARFVFAPINPLMYVWNRIAMPYLMLAGRGDVQRVSATLRLSLFLMVGIVLAIAIAAIAGYDAVDRHLFKGKVDQGQGLILVWGLYYSVAVAELVLVNFAIANRHFAALFQFMRLVLIVAIGLVSTLCFIDVIYVPLGLLIAEALMLWRVFRLVRREMRIVGSAS